VSLGYDRDLLGAGAVDAAAAIIADNRRRTMDPYTSATRAA
jgi:hypothetical protein